MSWEHQGEERIWDQEPMTLPRGKQSWRPESLTWLCHLAHVAEAPQVSTPSVQNGDNGAYHIGLVATQMRPCVGKQRCVWCGLSRWEALWGLVLP